MLDTTELTRVMDRLESLADEALAVSLLKEFNDKTSKLGVLLKNLDANLSHEEWKKRCDRAQAEVDAIVDKILKL